VTTLLVISQFLNGFGSYSLLTLSYVLLSDFCSSKYRQVGSILINSAWGFSTVLLGYLYVIDINWLTFLVWALEAPLFFTAIAVYFILIESPYILIRQNKRK
jgi:MFS family permease